MHMKDLGFISYLEWVEIEYSLKNYYEIEDFTGTISCPVSSGSVVACFVAWSDKWFPRIKIEHNNLLILHVGCIVSWNSLYIANIYQVI